MFIVSYFLNPINDASFVRCNSNTSRSRFMGILLDEWIFHFEFSVDRDKVYVDLIFYWEWYIRFPLMSIPIEYYLSRVIILLWGCNFAINSFRSSLFVCVYNFIDALHKNHDDTDSRILHTTERKSSPWDRALNFHIPRYTYWFFFAVPNKYAMQFIEGKWSISDLTFHAVGKCINLYFISFKSFTTTLTSLSEDSEKIFKIHLEKYFDVDEKCALFRRVCIPIIVPLRTISIIRFFCAVILFVFWNLSSVHILAFVLFLINLVISSSLSVSYLRSWIWFSFWRLRFLWCLNSSSTLVCSLISDDSEDGFPFLRDDLRLTVEILWFKENVEKYYLLKNEIGM